VADGRLTPVWLLANEITRDEQAHIDLRVAGRAAPLLRLGSADAAPFHAKALLRLEPDIGLASCFNPDCGAVLPLDEFFAGVGGLLLRPDNGRLVVECGAHHAVVAEREAIFLVDLDQIRVRLAGVMRLDCFAIAGANVTDGMAAAAAAFKVCHRQNDALQLLGNYGAALMRGLMPLNSVALRDLAVKHMCDLVGLICDAAPGPAAPGNTDRAASRLAAIKSDVEARLNERSLSAGRMAKLHRVSLRYLQKLFETEGITFSEFVLARRLDRAMHLLQSPEKTGHSISQIAFEAGFGDLSYFNRTFRKRFGTTPRLARADRMSS